MYAPIRRLLLQCWPRLLNTAVAKQRSALASTRTVCITVCVKKSIGEYVLEIENLTNDRRKRGIWGYTPVWLVYVYTENYYIRCLTGVTVLQRMQISPDDIFLSHAHYSVVSYFKYIREQNSFSSTLTNLYSYIVRNYASTFCNPRSIHYSWTGKICTLSINNRLINHKCHAACLT